MDRNPDIEIKFIQGVYAIPRTLDTRDASKTAVASTRHHDLHQRRNEGPETLGIEL